MLSIVIGGRLGLGRSPCTVLWRSVIVSCCDCGREVFVRDTAKRQAKIDLSYRLTLADAVAQKE